MGDDEFSWKWLTSGWSVTAFVLVLLVVVFYVVEDWSGSVSWSQAQSEIAAHGESLDPKKFIPPTVTDEQNFGVLPIFEVHPDLSSSYSYSWDYSAVGMTRAFASINPDNLPTSAKEKRDPDQLPYLGSWEANEPSDLPAIRKQLAEMCQNKLKNVHVPPDATPVEMFGLLCPALADLRATNETHPFCRFDSDYTTTPPASRSIGVELSLFKLARVLSYEERLALLCNQPVLALEDLKLGWKVDAGMRLQPSLVSGLISIGLVAIQMGPVTEGLARHSWNDQQLAELDQDLEKNDFLSENQFCIRGEVAVMFVPTNDYLKNHRLRIQQLMVGGPPPSTLETQFSEFVVACIVSLIPNGWFDEFKAADVRVNLLGSVTMIDPASRRVFPEREKRVTSLIEDSTGPVLSGPLFGSVLSASLNSVKRFAYAQVQVDEARIACRLERYRLAHRVYPDSLKALIPAYGPNLPNDVMNGLPFHYRLLPDGTYRLYSVGWDQVDGGGQNPLSIYHGSQDPDWTWTNHPDATKTK